MQKIMGDTRGVSVVVGAILLTLIVVTAATTYAIFLSEQQKKVQDAASIKQQRELENITILSLEPVYNSPILSNVSFVLVNINTEQTIITSMNINNNYVRAFNITRDGRRERYTMPYNGTGKRPMLQPRESVTLNINLSNNDIVLFKNITKTDAITLHIFTSLTNDFFKTFYPPTAIISIETDAVYNRSSGSFDEIIVLDGSKSDQPGDDYITRWEWNITTNNSGITEYDLNKTGRKIRAQFLSSGFYHIICLTVTDNYGMIATDTVEYYY